MSRPVELQRQRGSRLKGKVAEVRAACSGRAGWACLRTGTGLSRLVVESGRGALSWRKVIRVYNAVEPFDGIFYYKGV